MSPAVRLFAFLNRNIVAVVMIPSIVLIHWGWLKLQDVEALVKKEEKKDLPVLLAVEYLVEKAEGTFQSFKKDDTSKPTSSD
ncbi:unnamed protein product [Timema podura]|uniref:Uncharacterized protein n=1 Tax=Timema podura TaxID=61482 RepID=A0ABN7NNS9_TIMPD|nr:unnamed protein product [Timema podura]